MKLDSKEILELLLKHDYIEESDMRKALQNDSEDPVGFLIREEILSTDLVNESIAESAGIIYTKLRLKNPSDELIKMIPEALAEDLECVVVSDEKSKLTVATSLINNLDKVKKTLSLFFPGKKIEITFSPQDEIFELFQVYKKTLNKRLKTLQSKEKGVAASIFEEIITDALEALASDIHVEPQEDKVLIRFRIDGVLREVGEIEKELYINLLNRIKVLANLRLDEHYSTQDGAIRINLEEGHIDLRVSIAPTVNGQNVVIRILSQYISDLSLGDLGLSEKDASLLERSYKKPFGMILAAGPTGSGKTTTLYAILKKIQSPGVNITTIEDPVEYKIPKINQIQVSAINNITFANGLRSIVRQDPNVILVGEIRDVETSEIAVNAALTGHLLLTTFHANDASSVIPRLIDMGVEPFLLASTINLIVAQRLARRICASCRYSYQADLQEIKSLIPNYKKYFREDKITLYKGKGCAVCNNTGYKGRVGIFELIYITPEIQEIIMKNPSSGELAAKAYEQGARSFFEDGMDKTKNGLISLEEFIRIVPQNFIAKEVYEKK